MKRERIDLTTERWKKNEDSYCVSHLLAQGFKYLDEVMTLRVFDLLNIFTIDAIIAGGIVLALYRRFNPNLSVDEGLETHTLEDCFPYGKWKKEHNDPKSLTVGELVMTPDINCEAIEELWDWICKAFWKSDEYNCREYRYWSYQHLKRERRLKNEQK